MKTEFNLFSYIKNNVDPVFGGIFISGILSAMIVGFLCIGEEKVDIWIAFLIFLILFLVLFIIAMVLYWFFSVPEDKKDLLREMKDISRDEAKLLTIIFRLSGRRYQLEFKDKGGDIKTWYISGDQSPQEYLMKNLGWKESLKYYRLIKKTHEKVTSFYVMNELK